ncbi:MAG: Gfo/Idh/MocA family protein [Anaerolineae bacterium]
MGNLRGGIIGIGGFGRMTLAGMLAAPNVAVVAVADYDTGLAQSKAAEIGATAYDSYERLVREAEIDALFLALPHYLYPDLIRLAADRGLHVYKEKPLARNYPEAKALVELMESRDLRFMIGTQRRWTPGFRTMKGWMERIGRVFLARGQYVFCWGPDFHWRGSLEQSGGGALLDMGYHTVDMINWFVGLPDEVYAAASNIARPRSEHPYETDDTAVTLLRWNDGAMGYLLTSWVSSPAEEKALIHGSEGTLVADWQGVTLMTPTGDVLEEYKLDREAATGAAVYASMVEHFANAVQQGFEPQCSGRANLANMALVEAAYRSVRTHLPQHPREILAE